MTVGFSDTCCAPPAVYSAFNAIPSKDKKMLEGYGMGHAISPEFNRAFTQWLAEPDAAPRMRDDSRLAGVITDRTKTRMVLVQIEPARR